MIITHALIDAENEYVVYFLLTSYIEALNHLDAPRTALPPEVMRLPFRDKADLNARVAALNNTIAESGHGAPALPLMQEVLEVFRAAGTRLSTFNGSEARSAWNIVERSQYGHERRRRLGWPMSDREAAEWAQKNGMQLERAARPNV